MITARVSHVAAFARWRQEEDQDIGWLLNQITSTEQTPQMAKGTAFHKFLELAREGSTDQVTVDGYTFAFVGDFELYLPPMREWRQGKDYGGIEVSGQVDAILGSTIYDHKSTERFDAEGYLESWQWRYYLDIFGADRFIWNIWEMNELREPQSYGVHTLHRMEQFRYRGMGEDCQALALEYKAFVHRYLPEVAA